MQHVLTPVLLIQAVIYKFGISTTAEMTTQKIQDWIKSIKSTYVIYASITNFPSSRIVAPDACEVPWNRYSRGGIVFGSLDPELLDVWDVLDEASLISIEIPPIRRLRRIVSHYGY